MKLCVASRTIMTTLSLLFLFSACSLFESDKEKADRFVRLGMEAQKENKTDEAIIQFKNALQKDPLHSGAHYALGKIYLEIDKPQLAAMELNLAISQNSKMTEAKLLPRQTLISATAPMTGPFPCSKELAEEGKPGY